MAIIRDLSRAQLVFEVEGGAPDQFIVLRYRGTEGLSQLYRFEIELSSDEPEVAFDDVVGKPAILSINAQGGTRFFHGLVSRFEVTNQVNDRTYFRAELVPHAWLLTHRYNSRIFQEMNVQDIIQQVLTDGGIPSDRFRFSLQGNYKLREYCVQYRETDYNFISRLMEEEGIWWMFEQSTSGHVLVMADSAAAYAPVEGDSQLPFVPLSGMNNEDEHVFRFRLGQSVRPGAVVLRDFNFEKPSLNLEAKSDVGRDTGLEISDYPGEYTDQNVGANLAKIRAEELESGRILGVGQTSSHRLVPGRTFKLAEHPSDPLNRSYVVTALTHQGKQHTDRSTTGTNGYANIIDPRVHQSLVAARQNNDQTVRDMADAMLQLMSKFQPGDPTDSRAVTQWLYHAGQLANQVPSVAAALGANPLTALGIPSPLENSSERTEIEQIYECRFECIPDEVSYRPPRTTPWPKMRGSQTARVVGKGGEEIHTDEYGRVKVQFNWDREGKFDDKSSCWIRVSQGMAGGGYGMMFLPRVGQEVVVDFLEGDPDKPLITGRVYNKDHMPPYSLPDEKTKSVIKTHSSKGGGGSNEVRFEDLKGKEQILIHGEKDLHVRVKNDRVENVDNDHHLTVKSNKFELVKKAKNTEVTLDLNAKVGGKYSLEVGGDAGEKVAGNHSIEAGGNIYLKGGQNIVIEASMGVTMKVGGNFVKVGPEGVTIMGSMVMINSGGAAGAGQAVALTAPESAIDADEVVAGKDTTYSGGGELTQLEPPKEVEGHEFKQSWIEVQLVDEEGQPVAGEVVEIIGPEGESLGSTLTGNDGVARVLVDKPGNCEISFPNLDASAWERG
jgi:Rhs element Vgr protein